MKRRITDCSGNALTSYSFSLLLLLFTFWKQGKEILLLYVIEKNNDHQSIWTFSLTCLADECTSLRLRSKTMTAWNMRIVYIYILYPFENNIFCCGRQLFSQRRSLFVRKHTRTHTYKHYTRELMASGSTWTKLSIHIYSMVIIFPQSFALLPAGLILMAHCLCLENVLFLRAGSTSRHAV